MLVRLTEVCSNGAVTMPNNYILRLNERGLVANELDSAHRFSKLTINRGHAGTEIIVIGAPDTVETKLQQNTNQLLRG